MAEFRLRVNTAPEKLLSFAEGVNLNGIFDFDTGRGETLWQGNIWGDSDGSLYESIIKPPKGPGLRELTEKFSAEAEIFGLNGENAEHYHYKEGRILREAPPLIALSGEDAPAELYDYDAGRSLWVLKPQHAAEYEYYRDGEGPQFNFTMPEIE